MDAVHAYRPDVTAGQLIRLAKDAGPDRLPDDPALPPTRVWIYAGAQFEIAALHTLVAEGFAANRHVDYARNYADIESTAVFRKALTGDAGQLEFSATGDVVVTVDGVETIGGAIPAGASLLEIRVSAPVGTPAALSFALPEPAASTEFDPVGDRSSGWEPGWQYRDAVGVWRGTEPRPGDATPPHAAHEPTVELAVTEIEPGVYELPAPVLGRVVVRAAERPVVAVGESLEEALAPDELRESRCDVESVGPGEWRAVHRLGFRYVVVRGAQVESVRVVANVRPAPTRGAFVCSDPQLNRIWSTSAYTLRLCQQVFQLDGIKRDRMPWLGDYALGILANAYTFADADVIRTGLRALGHPRHGYVNGIADYSLWWLIAHGLYQRHFGDRAFAEAEADGIHTFLTHLATFAGDDEVFRPGDEPDAFAGAGPGSVFIDWGVTVDATGISTALQLLWFWAVDSAARVLGSVDHPAAPGWAARAARIRTVLLARGWDEATQTWREYLAEAPTTSIPSGGYVSPGAAYANFLAIQSGIEPRGAADGPSASAAALELIRTSGGATPFMRSFALRSLGAAGDVAGAVAEIRAGWGAMLDAGAQTFWEEFAEPGSHPYEMYGRPFGKSLCHAWAAGPAALLPELVLGIHPVSDGWRTFSVAPQLEKLGELDWACAVVPVPGGQIVVTAHRDGNVRVEVPEGSTLLLAGTEYAGPRRVRWNAAVLD